MNFKNLIRNLPSLTSLLFLLFILGFIASIQGSLESNASSKHSESLLMLKAFEEDLGPGITLTILGGFPLLLADFSWIRMNAFWEAQDIKETEKWIHRATTLDPHNPFFWINGARIIAYDFPHWLTHFENPCQIPPRIIEKQVLEGIAFMKQGLAYNPENPQLLSEIKQMTSINQILEFE